MLVPFKQRTVIIGNCRSGKSTLAGCVGALANVPAIDLDLLHWADDGYGVKRAETDARQMVHEAAAKPGWVIEGVYGWLAEVALPRATALIWLDVPWGRCREGLNARGKRRGSTDADFVQLVAGEEAYWERRTPSSFAGHQRLFEGFPGAKRRFNDRQEIQLFLAELRTGQLAS